MCKHTFVFKCSIPPKTSPELRSLGSSGDARIGRSCRGWSTTYSRAMGHFTASTYVVEGPGSRGWKPAVGFSIFSFSFLSNAHLFSRIVQVPFFFFKLTLQGIEISFPGNTGLDGSHPSNEPPWRRLGDVSSQLGFPVDAS